MISEVLAGTWTGKCRVRQAEGWQKKTQVEAQEKYQLPVLESVTPDTNGQLSGGKTTITS